MDEAQRYAPIIRFDEREPFLPERCAVTVFVEPGRSPSFPREVVPPDGGLSIEYAIWWDWDIGHLYELEHVWVHVDGTGSVIAAEASSHGGMGPMEPLTLEGEGVVVVSQPGKHAFAPDESFFRIGGGPGGAIFGDGRPHHDSPRGRTGRRSECGFLAGSGGVLVKDIFEDVIPPPTPLEDTLVRTYLQRHAFEPSWRFTKRFDVALVPFVDWPSLAAWIPGRVRSWLDRLARETPPEDYRFRWIVRSWPGWTTFTERAARAGAHGVYVEAQPGAFLDADLAVCRGETLRVLLELGDRSHIDAVVDEVRRHRMGGWVVVTAGEPGWLAEYRRLVPRARTCLRASNSDDDALAMASACGATFVMRRLDGSPEASAFVQRAREARLGVMAWANEDPHGIETLRPLALDGIVARDPLLLL